MDAVITQGVTLRSPAAMTQEQLVAEVIRLQSECMKVSMALHRMNCVAHSQAEAMQCLVDAHERGDAAALKEKLQELSDWRKQQQQRPLPH